MFTIGGLVSASETSNTIAERYLGALTLPEGVGESAQALAAAAADARPDLAPIASAMTALANPALASARAEYSSELDSLLSASEFGGAAAQRHRELCERLGLSTALAERLSLDAYYGWLVDLAETGERSRLEACEEVCAVARPSPFALLALTLRTSPLRPHTLSLAPPLGALV